ncbi:hypothetical protein E4K10_42895 [Streptomyces sp. T1317-0309]|nr:hypothetical protein E4K10_42895 [Streptomyces sp. T1317-0309]
MALSQREAHPPSESLDEERLKRNYHGQAHTTYRNRRRFSCSHHRRLFAAGGSASAATLPDRAHSWAAVGTVKAETRADGHSDRYDGRDGGNRYRYEDGRSYRYDDGRWYHDDSNRSYRQDEGCSYRYDSTGESRVDYRYTPWVADQLAMFVDHGSSGYGHLDRGGF